jgi:WD40 repeat protein
MGNKQSTENDQMIDESNYNIDAEDRIQIPNFATPLDIKSNKMYIIYHRIQGMAKTYVLSIKIIDNNILIYVTNIISNKTILAHATKISQKSDINFEKYIPYIQISRDFKLLSIPENDKIIVYNLPKLLNKNILEYVDNIGIVLKTDIHGNVISEIEYSKLNKNIPPKQITESYNTDAEGTIHMDQKIAKIQPYKCILCKDLYIIISIDNNKYKQVFAVDYRNKILHEVINLDLEISSSVLRFSENGKYVIIYSDIHKNIYMCNMTDSKPHMKKLKIIITSDTILNTVTVSDDGRFIFYISNDDIQFKIYDISHNKTYSLGIGLKINKQQLKEIKFHIMDYSKFSDIRLADDICNSLYVLVGWSKKLSSAYYWMIRCHNKGYKIYGPSYIEMKIEGEIEYVYNNGYMFIYKTQSGIVVYDLNKIIPIRFAGLLASGMKDTLTALFNEKYYTSDYYSSIDIKGAEDNESSLMKYQISPFMQFLMSLHKNNQTNLFHLRVNSNINIYGITKSFNIFENLLTGKINQTDVITNIFTVPGTIGRHNMMAELMDHFYEYIRVIALKENDKGELDDSEFSINKSNYIGYILIVLLLKYYSMMLKTMFDKEYKEYNENVSNVNKYNYFDIMHTFNNHFPAFKDFITKSIDILMDEKN